LLGEVQDSVCKRRYQPRPAPTDALCLHRLSAL